MTRRSYLAGIQRLAAGGRPADSVLPYDISFDRQYNPYGGDFFTYGQGPSHKFFDDSYGRVYPAPPPPVVEPIVKSPFDTATPYMPSFPEGGDGGQGDGGQGGFGGMGDFGQMGDDFGEFPSDDLADAVAAAIGDLGRTGQVGPNAHGLESVASRSPADMGKAQSTLSPEQQMNPGTIGSTFANPNAAWGLARPQAPQNMPSLPTSIQAPEVEPVSQEPETTGMMGASFSGFGTLGMPGTPSLSSELGISSQSPFSTPAYSEMTQQEMDQETNPTTGLQDIGQMQAGMMSNSALQAAIAALSQPNVAPVAIADMQPEQAQQAPQQSGLAAALGVSQSELDAATAAYSGQHPNIGVPSSIPGVSQIGLAQMAQEAQAQANQASEENDPNSTAAEAAANAAGVGIGGLGASDYGGGEDDGGQGGGQGGSGNSGSSSGAGSDGGNTDGGMGDSRKRGGRVRGYAVGGGISGPEAPSAPSVPGEMQTASIGSMLGVSDEAGLGSVASRGLTNRGNLGFQSVMNELKDYQDFVDAQFSTPYTGPQVNMSAVMGVPEVRDTMDDQGKTPSEAGPGPGGGASNSGSGGVSSGQNSDGPDSPGYWTGGRVYARGGLVDAARRVGGAGRRGDTMLAHISPREARSLDRVQGGPSFNPQTGLREYFGLDDIGDFFGDIVDNDFVRGALPVAGGLLGGALGGPFGAAAGAALGSLAAGNDIEDALLSGAISGVGAYAVPKLAANLGLEGISQGAFGGGGEGADAGALLGDAGGGAAASAPSALQSVGNAFTSPLGLLALGGGGLMGVLKGSGGDDDPSAQGAVQPLSLDNWSGTEQPWREGRLDQRAATPYQGDYLTYGQNGGEHQFYDNVNPPLRFDRGGPVFGPGDGQSDEISAMLSKGEFVIPADAVAAAGAGDNDAGADRFDALVKQLRQHRNSSGGKLPPKPRQLRSYLGRA